MDGESAAGCAGEGHALGSHRLGPHVVGQRVVVRHLLDDGRASDVLGTCLSWTDAEMVVDRDPRGDDPGEPVRIPVATIVTGKPVPPRASVRNRLSPRGVEGHALVLWPDVATVDLGEWQLRAAPAYDGRLRKRATSLLAMGDPGMSVDEATGHAVAFFAERDLPPLAQTVLDSEEEAALLAAGWRHLGSGDAHCQLASVARAVRSCNTLSSALPRRWNGVEVHQTACYMAEGPRVEVTLADGAARGRAAVDGDWLGIHDLHVDEQHRRSGLGTAVVAELLDWGASQGAMTAFVHVETDDTASLSLHERLGFVTHHTYGYLTR
jgi:GNAT superfamily N-acetyltransferase